MAAPDSLSSNIVYLCGEFAHRMHQKLTKSFKEHRIPVTVEQFSVLALLFYQDGINQQDISTMLRRDKTTITRVISIMERDNMIKRITDKDDNRGKLIFLTKKGRAIQQKAVNVSGKLYIKAIANLKASQMNVAMTIIKAMTENISQP